MAAPIVLRNDFDSVSLRRLAKRTRDATQSRRLLAFAAGRMRRGSAALQIIRDWVLQTPIRWSMGSHRAHPDADLTPRVGGGC